ncbi:hypothetical protein BOX15_Mlig030385g2, partial [Macrostomum lignano]
QFADRISNSYMVCHTFKIPRGCFGLSAGVDETGQTSIVNRVPNWWLTLLGLKLECDSPVPQ